MHKSSLDKMAGFVSLHMAPLRGSALNILDLGSLDVNGSYRFLFDDPSWRYQGMDMEKGNNVDIVLTDPYSWDEIASASQDIIISGQAFEHIEFFWIVMDEIARIAKPGALICILAPSRGYEHRYPVDCWRFYPDAFKALARYAGFELLSAETQWDNLGYEVDDSDSWGDTLAVLRKPMQWPIKFQCLLRLRRWLNRLSLRQTF